MHNFLYYYVAFMLFSSRNQHHRDGILLRGEKNPRQAAETYSSWNLPCTKSMNCVSEITNYVRAMKQSAFYPFCPHPHFIPFVRIRILTLLSASAFYPFCPHPHCIPFVRILSFLSVRPRVRPSVSAFYPNSV